MAEWKNAAQEAAPENSVAQKGVVLVGAVAVMVVCCGVIAWTGVRQEESERMARLEWGSYRDANCEKEASARQVTRQFGVDPRPDSKLTIYRCRDGESFATTRAFESQLEYDRASMNGLDSQKAL